MPQQHLDDTDVDILLVQVRGEAVAQCVRADTLLDASGFRCLMNGAVDLARRNWFERVPPGNNQPWGSMTPRRLPSRHQSRSSSNSCGDSMALRSLRPLPCSTRISIRVLSMSPILRAATSDTRNPAPYAVPRAALYFGPGAASSSRPTSSTLSTAGNLRGKRARIRRRDRSGRSSVTVKKKRSAETEPLIVGVVPRSRVGALETDEYPQPAPYQASARGTLRSCAQSEYNRAAYVIAGRASPCLRACAAAAH